VYEGAVIAVRRDRLTEADGEPYDREVVVHPGAVAILAIDDTQRVLVVTQYRHAARRRLVELPAGLLDQPGEDRASAARRELAEEGLIRAGRWTTLLELMPSPGASDELVTIFLAEDISDSEVPAGFVAHHEESSMTRDWVPLGDLVDAVLAGELTNGLLVAGVLAASERLRRGDAPAAPRPIGS
jgi:ADP-ribose pyrophosphatase